MTPRSFWLVSAVMLSAMAVIQVLTSRLETQTFDESTHLAAGLSYWETGDYRMNAEHPVLAKLLCALPLVLMGIKAPVQDES
jgi:hypothetical protein